MSAVSPEVVVAMGNLGAAMRAVIPFHYWNHLTLPRLGKPGHNQAQQLREELNHVASNRRLRCGSVCNWGDLSRDCFRCLSPRSCGDDSS
jgi:hypothetical protein